MRPSNKNSLLNYIYDWYRALFEDFSNATSIRGFVLYRY